MTERTERDGGRSGGCFRPCEWPSASSPSSPSSSSFPSSPSAQSRPIPRQAPRLPPRHTAPFDRPLWGVALVDEKGALLYGRNPRQLFIPASNTKIVVAAVASALLPPDWTVKTSLYAAGPVSGRRARRATSCSTAGATRRSAALLRDRHAAPRAPARPTPSPASASWPTVLRARGIREVHGDLVGDGSYFEPADRASGLGGLRPQLVVRGSGLRARLQRQQRGLRVGPRHRGRARRR